MKKGFTLIELLVVIGIIAILAGATIAAINPARLFARAQNAQRWGNVNAIANAIIQNMTSNRGNWTCATELPITRQQIGNSADNFNLEDCIASYIPIMPYDPNGGTAEATGYYIVYNGTTRTVTIDAPNAFEETISVTR